MIWQQHQFKILVYVAGMTYFLNVCCCCVFFYELRVFESLGRKARQEQAFLMRFCLKCSTFTSRCTLKWRGRPADESATCDRLMCDRHCEQVRCHQGLPTRQMNNSTAMLSDLEYLKAVPLRGVFSTASVIIDQCFRLVHPKDPSRVSFSRQQAKDK